MLGPWASLFWIRVHPDEWISQPRLPMLGAHTIRAIICQVLAFFGQALRDCQFRGRAITSPRQPLRRNYLWFLIPHLWTGKANPESFMRSWANSSSKDVAIIIAMAMLFLLVFLYFMETNTSSASETSVVLPKFGSVRFFDPFWRTENRTDNWQLEQNWNWNRTIENRFEQVEPTKKL